MRAYNHSGACTGRSVNSRVPSTVDTRAYEPMDECDRRFLVRAEILPDAQPWPASTRTSGGPSVRTLPYLQRTTPQYNAVKIAFMPPHWELATAMCVYMCMQRRAKLLCDLLSAECWYFCFFSPDTNNISSHSTVSSIRHSLARPEQLERTRRASKSTGSSRRPSPELPAQPWPHPPCKSPARSRPTC